MAKQFKACSVDVCNNPVLARGWCGSHYWRWHKHGDPHGGNKAGKGEALRYFRETVLSYDGENCLIWPYSRSDFGYATLSGENKNVCRVVCEDANGPPPTPEHEAAHSCGKGHLGCVTKKHLVWKTHIENMADTLAHGTRTRGERTGSSKLTEDQVRQIRSLRGKMTNVALAELFGVSDSTISQIQTRKKWAWLD